MAKYKVTLQKGSDSGRIDMFGYGFYGTRTGDYEIILSLHDQMETDRNLLKCLRANIGVENVVICGLVVESVEEVQ